MFFIHYGFRHSGGAFHLESSGSVFNVDTAGVLLIN